MCSNYVCTTAPTTPPPTSGCKLLNEVCSSNTECCSSYCENSACATAKVCTETGSACVTGLECCTGYCKNSICSSLIECKNLGETCSKTSDCCTGYCVGGACDSKTCKDIGNPCSTSLECCSKTCAKSTCSPYQCKFNSQSCTSPAECCSGICKNYLCAPPLVCRKMGETCGSTSECCSGVCLNYVCKTPPACKDRGEWCYSNSECCTKKCKESKCSEYIATRFVEIRGNQTFSQGKSGAFIAVAMLENGQEEIVPAKWELDGGVGKLNSSSGENVTFSADKVGIGAVRIYYNDGTQTLTNLVPISVLPGPAVRIEIYYPKSVVKPNESIYFTTRGYDKDSNPVTITPMDIMWTASAGNVDQAGVFIAPKTDGNVTVTAKYHDYTTSARISVASDSNSSNNDILELIMAQVYRLLGQFVLAIIGVVSAIVILYFILRKLARLMEKTFTFPPIPAGSSILIEAPPESNANNNVYEILNREAKKAGKILILSLKAEETSAYFKRNIRMMNKIKIVGVEPDFTKVGIKLSELLENEAFTVVYFSFFGKVALAQGADVSGDFIEFNTSKLKKAKAIGIFPVELNEKLTSEFLSKLEMVVDIVVEHKVVDKEYVMIKQWKGAEFEKQWLRFK